MVFKRLNGKSQSLLLAFVSILMLFVFTSSGQCSYTRKDYASWIDFDNGRWFSIYHLAPPLRPWGDICDRMANRAFRYLVLGDTADKDYFIEKQMALANEDYTCIFGGKCGAHPHGDRIAQTLAEVYLAMRDTMSPAQRQKVEKWYHDAAEWVWRFPGEPDHQGTKGGFCAVAGYMTGDKDMLDRARRYFSYEDTWTPSQASRHYGSLIMERMFRIELFTHNFDVPHSSKVNLAKQMCWILDSFPHNGFNPAFGDCYNQNEVDHYMERLITGSYFLKDYDLKLAGECKWLAERMFEYGQNRFVPYTRVPMSMPAYLFQMNPIYLYWFLDESIVAKRPDINSHGSKIVYRLSPPWSLPPAPGDVGDREMDTDLPSFMKVIDKIIHRDSWDDNALFVMLDLAVFNVKNDQTGTANAILSISYGKEEFLTGRISMWDDDPLGYKYTHSSVTDIPSDPTFPGRHFDASLDSFVNNSDYSRSVTTLEGWRRTVTLYKTGDRRIEIKDYLPKAGNVYWHLQGAPAWGADKVILNVNGTKMEVTYSGHTSSTHQDNYTWEKTKWTDRWANTGDPDRQLKLHRSKAGTITTIFRPL